VWVLLLGAHERRLPTRSSSSSGSGGGSGGGNTKKNASMTRLGQYSKKEETRRNACLVLGYYNRKSVHEERLATLMPGQNPKKQQ
jgi:hypothetical protein